MPGTPITVNGPFTMSVDGVVVLVVASGYQATIPGSAVRTGPESFSLDGYAEVTSGQGTTVVPSGKTATLAGPGLGIP